MALVVQTTQAIGSQSTLLKAYRQEPSWARRGGQATVLHHECTKKARYGEEHAAIWAWLRLPGVDCGDL